MPAVMELLVQWARWAPSRSLQQRGWVLGHGMLCCGSGEHRGPNPGLAHHLKEGTFWRGPRWTKSGEGVWASRKVRTGGSGMSERGPMDELTGFVDRGHGSQVRRGSEGVR